MKHFIKYCLLISGIFTSLSIFSQIPEKPNPPRLVNDFAGVFTPEQTEGLERKLDTFDDSTSTQIVVVTVKDLGNYDPNQFAYEIGQSWGVGQKGKNNGLVILLKPKTSDSRGQVSIQVAYGLEDVVTDALSKSIIEYEMKPSFIKGDYYSGINRAVDILMKVTKNKYAANQYIKKHENQKQGSYFAIIVFMVMFIIIIGAFTGNKNNSNRHTMGRRGSNIPFWMLMGGMMGSSGKSSSGWGGFSSGGGGFGGFGGGSFGGGGASGSW